VLTIDLIDDLGVPVLRYKSNHIPRVKETLSFAGPIPDCWEVLKIDHLLSRQFNKGSIYLQLITITVRKVF